MFDKLLEKLFLPEFARGRWRKHHNWLCSKCGFKITAGELRKYCEEHDVSYDKERFPQPCPKCGSLMEYF